MTGTFRRIRRLFAKRAKIGRLQVDPIRTHGLAVFWRDHGSPRELGAQITVDMRSGRKAIFKLVKIERAWGCDWDFYDFDFVRYQN